MNEALESSWDSYKYTINLPKQLLNKKYEIYDPSYIFKCPVIPLLFIEVPLMQNSLINSEFFIFKFLVKY